MKALLTAAFLMSSLPAFSSAQYECFKRKGRFGTEDTPIARVTQSMETILFYYLPSKETLAFDKDTKVTRSNPRSGSWIVYTNDEATLSTRNTNFGGVTTLTVPGLDLVVSMKCREI